MNFYVASSWRNKIQPQVVKSLRDLGHEAYDFKDSEGFHWSEVDPDYQSADGSVDKAKDLDRYIKALSHPRAEQGFRRDFDAMEAADAFILVLPCGRSAHLEAGWAIGKGKPTCVFMPDFDGTWDLMYKMAVLVSGDWEEMLAWVKMLAWIKGER